jgi:hypothetical protein
MNIAAGARSLHLHPTAADTSFALAAGYEGLGRGRVAGRGRGIVLSSASSVPS